MFLDEKRYANYHCDQYKCTTKGYEDDPRIETLSIGEMMDKLKWMADNCKSNKQDPYEVPVFIAIDGLGGSNRHCIHGASIGVGTIGIVGTFETQVGGEYSDRFYYVAPDSRPDDGEYWKSRGVSEGYDVSGFVVSKKAGERILNMVRIVLDNQEPKSWLDYREREPNWIQFKFKPEEFDLHKLDELSKAAGGVMTFDILRASIIKKEE